MRAVPSGGHRLVRVRIIDALAAVLVATIVGISCPEASAAEPGCGRPVGTSDSPKASDCRSILRSAVGLRDCARCLCDLDGSGEVLAADALGCLRLAVGLDGTLACPECNSGTTTTTLPDPCPAAVEWTTRGGYGPSCVTNADCEAGTCDPAAGHCRTASRLDIGWVGVQHGGDLNDGDVLKLKVDCDSAGPTCGQCAITGVDPSAGNCRCANDLRKTCSEPFAASSSECGGAECRCYAGAPLPAIGHAPTCFLPRLGSAPSGTINVDSGDIDFSVPMRLMSHLGLAVASPCPLCGGKCANGHSCLRDTDCGVGGPCTFDPVPRDGQRGGVCVGGESDGLSCDVQAFHRALLQIPALGLSPFVGNSLDCPPESGALTSGAGVNVRWRETTSTSTLEPGLSCGGPNAELSCPCLLCSGDPSTPCQADTDCAGQEGRCSLASGLRCSDHEACAQADVGPCRTISNLLRCDKIRSLGCTSNSDCVAKDAGTCTASSCSSTGGSEFPLPNQCEDLLCADDLQVMGKCTTGPEDGFCSKGMTPDGRGTFACATDEDCSPSTIGYDAGDCVKSRRGCFADTIEANGSPDPHAPLTGATMCVGPFGSSGTRSAYGLPGPARLQRQGTLRALCASDPSRVYEPGVGGCLD